MASQVWNLTAQAVHFNVKKLSSSAIYLGTTKQSECPIQQGMLNKDLVDLWGPFPAPRSLVPGASWDMLPSALGR